MAELGAALEAAWSGQNSVFLLSGEPGIGKTRLAEALADHAESRGARVLWGRSWEVEGAPACWPWVSVVRLCAETEEGAAFVRADPLGAELAPLLSLDGMKPGASPELAQLRLAAAIGALVRRVAAPRPLVLVFDDLHASDLASLHLWQLVLRELRGARVLVVGTYREAEARRRPGVSAVLARSAREGMQRSLGGLDEAAIAQCLESILRRPPPPALVATIREQTEGNPLFVGSLAQVILARGGVELPAERVLPDSVRGTVEEILAGVSAPAREVLEAAAVLGRECVVASLEQVSQRPLEEVIRAVDEGIAAGVLSPQPRTSVRFAHILIREAIYQALPTARRLAWHAACASALRGVYAAGLDECVAELAHHAFESGPACAWGDAELWATRAGERALRLFAFDEAAKWFARALTALDLSGGGSDAHRAALLTQLGLAQIHLGRAEEGRESCEQAATIARRLGDEELFARAALALGSNLVVGLVDERLIALLEEARRGLPDPATRALVMVRLAAASLLSGGREEPLRLAQEAVSLARSLGDPRTLAQVLSLARQVYNPGDDLDARILLDRELVSLSRALGDRLLETQAHAHLALDTLEQGNAEGVEHELRLHQQLAEATRVPAHQLRGAGMRLLWATLKERASDREQAEEEIRALGELAGDPAGLVSLEANRLASAALRGDASDLEVSRLVMRTWVVRHSPEGALDRIVALVFLGQAEEAQAQLRALPTEEAASILRVVGPSPFLLWTPILIALDDRRWLRAVYELLLPFQARIVVNLTALVGGSPVALSLGLLAAALGQTEDAASHLRAALAVSLRLGFPGVQARLQSELGKLALPSTAPAAPAALPASEPLRLASMPSLHQDGETWVLSHEGRSVRLKATKGLRYLEAILRDPGREFHVGELVEQADQPPLSSRLGGHLALGDAGEMLDARAKEAYRARLGELRGAIEDAESRSDPASVARLRHEHEMLTRELARAMGLGGRDRKASSASERARINVQRRLRDVVQRVTQLDEALGRHLDLHLQTGVFCSWKR